jgi:hypothetical protein
MVGGKSTDEFSSVGVSGRVELSVDEDILTSQSTTVLTTSLRGVVMAMPKLDLLGCVA